MWHLSGPGQSTKTWLWMREGSDHCSSLNSCSSASEVFPVGGRLLHLAPAPALKPPQHVLHDFLSRDLVVDPCHFLCVVA